MMEEKIKEIVSGFIRVPAGQIGEGTPIGRGALQSSIHLHRMYARLGEEGIVVENYTAIRVFGDLIRSQGDGGAGATGVGAAGEDVRVGGGLGGDMMVGAGARVGADGVMTGGTDIGIDIEEVTTLPRVVDFRKDIFYSQNFTAAEIAYCILQPDPYSSFAGLFAVKEAIIKADGRFRGRPFHTVEIGHSEEGKPVFPGFGLSISHAGGMAVAVAVRGGAENQPVSSVGLRGPEPAGRRRGGGWIGWMALLLAAAALLLALKH
jgi:phosphopantetheinyl transferase (holo-ACP synthase)